MRGAPAVRAGVASAAEALQSGAMGERLLVIGGSGAGVTAAVHARRRRPELEIVVVERGVWASAAASGAPALVDGSVRVPADLVVRGPDELRAMRIDVRTRHDVAGIDLVARKAEIVNVEHGRSFQLGFDLLHVATGGRARRPGVPGIDLPHVHGVRTVDDAARLVDDARDRRGHVVVIGSDYTGLLLGEAFARTGSSVTVVEPDPEVMGTLDPEMGALVARALRDRGITVRAGEAVVEVTDAAVRTSSGEVAADLVILGLGAEPDVALAAGAGLPVGVTGALAVDRCQRTPFEGVWAAGDCCQTVHLVSGLAVHSTLATVAARQGRVVGIGAGGGYATFPGVLGTAVIRLHQVEVGRTGLSEREALAAGFAVVAPRIEAATSAGYVAGAAPAHVKLVAERGSGRLLGAQIVGGPGSAKRVDTVAAALAGRLTLDDLAELDLGHAPPLSPLMDPLQAVARRALALLA